MKEIKGNPHNLKNSIIGKFCIKNNIFVKNKILFCTKKPLFSAGIKAFLVSTENMFKTNLPVIEIKNNEIPFDNGDVLNISKEALFLFEPFKSASQRILTKSKALP